MKRRSSSAAFSLLELLTAVSISIVLLALILGILSTALNTWHFAGTYRHQHQAAQILIDTIESDLQATLIRPSLPSDGGQSVPWLKLENFPVLDQSSSRMSLLAPIPDQSPAWRGDVCLVHYGLAQRITRDGKNVILFRELRDPAATFANEEWGAVLWSEAEEFRPASAVASNLCRFQISLEVRSEDGSTKLVEADTNPIVFNDGDVTWNGSSGRHRLLAVHVNMEILGLTGVNILFDRGYSGIPEKEKRAFFVRVPLADGRQKR